MKYKVWWQKSHVMAIFEGVSKKEIRELVNKQISIENFKED